MRTVARGLRCLATAALWLPMLFGGQRGQAAPLEFRGKLRYKVDLIAPKAVDLGEVVLTRLGSKVRVDYRDPDIQFRALFDPDYTMIARGESPARHASLFTPESFGRVPFAPLLVEGVYPWDLTERDKSESIVRVVNIDAVGGVGQHSYLETKVSYGVKGLIERLETSHGGARVDTWAFADYEEFGGVPVPREIRRTLHKMEGTSRIVERTVVWRLLNYNIADGSEFDVSKLVVKGGTIQDNRQPSRPTQIKYRPNDALDDQLARARTETPQADLPQPAGPLPALTGLVLGGIVGMVAMRRFNSQ